MPNKKAEELNKKIALLENWLTKEEFVTAFEGVINYVKKWDTKIDLMERKAIQDLIIRIDAKAASIRDGRDGKDGQPGKDGVDGVDGSDADEQAITKRVIDALTPLIPKELLGEDMRNALEALSGAERLKMSAIDGLEEALKNIEQKVSSQRIISPRYVHTPMTDPFTGDGSTKVFTLSKAPKDLRTVKLHSRDFPYILMNNDGFTIAGRTLTIAADFDAPTNNFLVDYYI